VNYSIFRLAKIECEFYKHVDLNQVSTKIGLDTDVCEYVYRYWILKRKAGGNKPLIVARTEEAQLLSSATCSLETEREKMKRFVSLRQDLERVRNLCYMVSRREKLQRSFVKLREQTLAKQLQLVSDENCTQQVNATKGRLIAKLACD
jgi:hypothetical protein